LRNLPNKQTNKQTNVDEITTLAEVIKAAIYLLI